MPRAWLALLAEGGLLELPLRLNGPTGAQAIATLRRQGTTLRSVSVVCGGFMPLRTHPGDPTPRLPSLSANDSLDGARPLVVLEGEAIGKLARPARRRLLATALGEPRSRPLGLRAPGASLFLYLSLETPANALVASWSDQATGVVRRDGRSLALVKGWERVDRISAYGGSEAEKHLARLLERWRKLGCPSEDELSIEVRFRGERSSMSWSWQKRPSRRSR